MPKEMRVMHTHLTFDAHCIPSIHLEFEFNLLKAGYSRTPSWPSLLEQLTPPGTLPETQLLRVSFQTQSPLTRGSHPL